MLSSLILLKAAQQFVSGCFKIISKIYDFRSTGTMPFISDCLLRNLFLQERKVFILLAQYKASRSHCSSTRVLLMTLLCVSVNDF